MVKLAHWCWCSAGGGLLAMSIGCAQVPNAATKSGHSTGRGREAIVGGHDESGYPAVGSLVDKHGAECTATLIAPTVLVTAAHCLTDGASGMTFETSQIVQQRKKGGGAGHGIPVASVHPHPNYNDNANDSGPDDPSAGDTTDYDIGVVLLEQASTETPMAFQTDPLDASWVGRSLLFVGYGSTSADADDGDRKRSVRIPISHVWSTTFGYESSTANTCFGDSGGPAIADTPSGPAVVGVTSWGDDQCNRFGVDTRVDSYADFVRGFLPASGSTPPTSGAGSTPPSSNSPSSNPPSSNSPSSNPPSSNPPASCPGGSSPQPSPSNPAGYDEATDGAPRLLGVYTLPSTPVSALNPFLTAHDLDQARQNGAPTVDAPGPGSGIVYLGGFPGTFAMITDRGINGDRPDGVTFPLPRFTPAVARVHLAGSAIAIDAALPIVDGAGTPVTGLPNDDNDDTPYVDANTSTPLPLNPEGLDTEDLAPLPSGDWAFVEEYAPSIGIIDGRTGAVKVRYTPSGVDPMVGYPVRDILPAVLVERRVNKGFENLAVSPDGKTAYAVLQAPLGDGKEYKRSRVNRIVRIDHFDDPANATVAGHFVVLHSATNAFDGTPQDKIYYSGASWVAPDKLLLLERASTRIRLVIVDLSGATNLVGKHDADDLSLETTSPDRQGSVGKVTAAKTQIVLDSSDLPALTQASPDGASATTKMEGVTIINRSTVAITNDNDFGIHDPNDRTRIWIVRLAAALPR